MFTAVGIFFHYLIILCLALFYLCALTLVADEKYIAENPLELVRKLRQNQTDLTSLRSFLGLLDDGYELAVLPLWFTCFAISKNRAELYTNL